MTMTVTISRVRPWFSRLPIRMVAHTSILHLGRPTMPWHGIFLLDSLVGRPTSIGSLEPLFGNSYDRSLTKCSTPRTNTAPNARSRRLPDLRQPFQPPFIFRPGLMKFRYLQLPRSRAPPQTPARLRPHLCTRTIFELRPNRPNWSRPVGVVSRWPGSSLIFLGPQKVRRNSVTARICPSLCNGGCLIAAVQGTRPSLADATQRAWQRSASTSESVPCPSSPGLRTWADPCAGPAGAGAQVRVASNTRWNGVCATVRQSAKPAPTTISCTFAGPAWVPIAAPTSWESEAGVHSSVEKP